MANSMELDGLSDEELQEISDRAGTLLLERKKEKQQAVLDSAREMLATAGLTLRDLARAGKRSAPKGKPAARPGETLTNPKDASQTWTPGRGRPPKWVTELQRGKA
jgi:DNA-binding protein H-NS